MNPVRFKVIKKEHTSFHIQENKKPYQYDQLHYHPEYQISLILKGTGLGSIGSSLDRFQSGDIYVIAPNIPHVFKNDLRYYEKPEKENTHMISLFFLPTAFGAQFLELPEMVQIKHFLQAAYKGIKLNSTLAIKLKKRILEMTKSTGARRVIHLLTLLNEIAVNKDWQFLSTIRPTFTITHSDNTMNKIFNYISKNFDRPISLEQMAHIAHLDKYAFCRYFKRMTHKSFIAYLNEFRIDMACKFLTSDTYSITQIGFLAGFNNLSNFYKQFKKIMNCTPSKYRELYGQ